MLPTAPWIPAGKKRTLSPAGDSSPCQRDDRCAWPLHALPMRGRRRTQSPMYDNRVRRCQDSSIPTVALPRDSDEYASSYMVEPPFYPGRGPPATMPDLAVPLRSNPYYSAAETESMEYAHSLGLVHPPPTFFHAEPPLDTTTGPAGVPPSPARTSSPTRFTASFSGLPMHQFEQRLHAHVSSHHHPTLDPSACTSLFHPLPTEQHDAWSSPSSSSSSSMGLS
ncbi:hypothetical protein Malapachy_2849 [Malassezia pachydermatis]|uniref:Uncharacterized protein n=1 Tax=Malassezia pachydermatis TaxID=77020 RepID=A0A0M9VMS3_9BASI|nr:hypothetical protein Malapachy_2849 [Malassezia pachydermatis]KOS12542.1 hypothetical protein Malapachy_2849 [Malassezia pachydermatis]